MLHFNITSPLPGLAFGFCLVIINPGFSNVYVYGNPRALDPKRVDAMDDDARVRLRAAMREMHKRGIRTRVNSTFRSRTEQQAIYWCAHSRRCRARRGVYGAKRPGTSMHEAGLAVDLGGMATVRRRGLTPKGRQTVRIMRKHGFSWRYGLKDPAHFEVSPQRVGYRTEQAAIKAAQRRWIKRQNTRHQARSRA